MNEKSDHGKEKINVPPYTENTVRPYEDIHVSARRKYINRNQILIIAEGYGKRGLTFNQVMKNFKVTQKVAQRTLKYFHARKILFTAKDLKQQGIELPPTFNDHIPQRYYPSSMKADILEKIRKDYRNVLVETTGIKKKGYDHFPRIEQQKASNFLEVLKELDFSLTYMHKINLYLSIGKDYYDEICRLNKGPPGDNGHFQERIGSRYVEFYNYPNGSVQVFVECSKNPLRMQTENDVNNFFSFIGQIRDRMIFQLYDRSELIIPPTERWILKQCDINNDIPITDKAQVTLPDIQLKFAGKVLRLYVKSFEKNAVYRIEDSKEVNLQLSQFSQFCGDNQSLEKKIDILIQKLDLLPLNSGKENTPAVAVYPFFPNFI